MALVDTKTLYRDEPNHGPGQRRCLGCDRILGHAGEEHGHRCPVGLVESLGICVDLEWSAPNGIPAPISSPPFSSMHEAVQWVIRASDGITAGTPKAMPEAVGLRYGLCAGAGTHVDYRALRAEIEAVHFARSIWPNDERIMKEHKEARVAIRDSEATLRSITARWLGDLKRVELRDAERHMWVARGMIARRYDERLRKEAPCDPGAILERVRSHFGWVFEDHVVRADLETAAIEGYRTNGEHTP